MACAPQASCWPRIVVTRLRRLSLDHLTYGYVFAGLLLACLVGLAAMFGSPRRAAAAGPRSAAMPSATNGSGGRIPLTATTALLMTTLPALAARPADRCPVVPILDPPQIVAPWGAGEPGGRLATGRGAPGC